MNRPSRPALLPPLAAALLLVLGTAPGTATAAPAAPAPGPAAPAAPAAAAAVPQPLTGRNAGDRRIVALDPGIAETLCMLGAGHRLVGRTAHTVHPDDLRPLPVVCDRSGHPDYDALAALRPDLVILPEAMLTADAHRELGRRGIPHFALRNESLADLYQSVFELADRFDAAEGAVTWLSHMEVLTSEASAHVARALSATGLEPPRVLFVLGRNPVPPATVYVAGATSLQQDVLAKLGLRNACAERDAIAAMPFDRAAALLPDLIVEVRADRRNADAAVLESLEAWAGHPEVPAVRVGAVHVVPEAWPLFAGPRVENLHALLATFAADWASKAAETRAPAAPPAADGRASPPSTTPSPSP